MEALSDGRLSLLVNVIPMAHCSRRRKATHKRLLLGSVFWDKSKIITQGERDRSAKKGTTKPQQNERTNERKECTQKRQRPSRARRIRDLTPAQEDDRKRFNSKSSHHDTAVSLLSTNSH